ncbi:MAG: STAS domain-containing protein [Candidatus Competibacteraceae bacterium]
MAVTLEGQGDGRFALQGELNLATVGALLEESGRLFQHQPPTWIDLAGVNHCDSAGVALLVEWLRRARADGRNLRFANLTPQMSQIIKVTDLDALLSLG